MIAKCKFQNANCKLQIAPGFLTYFHKELIDRISRMTRFSIVAATLLLFSAPAVPAGEQAKPIKILFLGDDGHHQPRERFAQLQPFLAKRHIELTYTDQVTDLNAKTLAGYDGLMIYANTTKISPEQ